MAIFAHRRAPGSRIAVPAVVLALLLAGCGSTRIMTNVSGARIYADGEMVGTGTGEMGQTGPPRSIAVTAVAPDGRRATMNIKRRFTIGTLVLGAFTYGVCLALCWNYPDTVFLHIEGAAAAGGGWDAASDPWLNPPGAWGGPPSTGAASP